MAIPKQVQAKLDLDEVDVWNHEDASELDRPAALSAYDILINARDWTVETIVQQIRQGNIDLDPAFQRRNAWRDQRRSRLIESFILSFPVPQIVLAENPRKKKSYIVIDGKQRLMTIAGMFLPEYRAYWKVPELSGLEILSDLNGVTLEAFLTDSTHSHAKRQLDNADIRATVISGFKDEGVLYDIFYRINTGSVPLSSQELRQVLNRGEFAQHLIAATSSDNPIWTLLAIREPDSRLRDVELLLRMIAWSEFSPTYAGNMKKFLDDAMNGLNNNWKKSRRKIEGSTTEIFSAVTAAHIIFEDDVGRKFKGEKFERVVNRALFEVQTFYLIDPAIRELAVSKRTTVVAAFKKLSRENAFLQSIESTTKSLENTRTRFQMYHKMLEGALNTKIPIAEIGLGA